MRIKAKTSPEWIRQFARAMKIPFMIIVPVSFVLGWHWGKQIKDSRDQLGGHMRAPRHLSVLAYSGILSPNLVQRLQDELNIIVDLDEVDSPEEFMEDLGKTSGGENSSIKKKYDLVTALSYQHASLKNMISLPDMDLNQLRNYKNISADFLHIPGMESNENWIPILWGVNGVLYDTNVFPRPLSSWGDLLEYLRRRDSTQKTSSHPHRFGFLKSKLDFLGVWQGLHQSVEAATSNVATNTFLSSKEFSFLNQNSAISQQFLSAASLFPAMDSLIALQMSHAETAFLPAHRNDWAFNLMQEYNLFWVLYFARLNESSDLKTINDFIDFILEKPSAEELVWASHQASTNRLTEESNLDPRLRPSFIRQLQITKYQIPNDDKSASELGKIIGQFKGSSTPEKPQPSTDDKKN